MQRTSTSRRAGFSLIEMVIVITIMAIIIGAAVPVTSKVVTYHAKKATKEELAFLGAAAEEFFRDTLALPATIEELVVDPNIDGWSGPYLAGVVTDELSGQSGYEVDAWSRAYRVTIAGDVWTLTSMGPDAAFDTASDLEIAIDVTRVRREVTRDQLDTINQAVLLYNAEWHASDPLDPTWSISYAQLIGKGFLPPSLYATDAWGDAFVVDPPGASVVTALESIHLGGSSSGGG